MTESPTPEYGSPGSVKIEIGPKESQFFPVAEFMDGKGELLIEDEDGKEIARIRANTKSNTVLEEGDIQSYDLILRNGFRVLLPFPTLFNLAVFSGIRPDEEALGVKWLIDRFSDSERNFGLKINSEGIAFRNLSGRKQTCGLEKMEDIAPGEETGRAGRFWKSETGEKGLYEGSINGGNPVSAITLREAGLCEKYPNANETNIGIGLDSGVMVVADGMGGGAFGEGASSDVVRSILDSDGSTLARKAIEAHQKLYIYNRQVYFTKAKWSNAVMAAVQVQGDEFKGVSVGDSRWLQFRDGKMIKKSRVRSWVGRQMEEGKMTEAEAMNHPARNVVETAMGGEFMPDVDSGTMEDGDFMVVFDDGMGLTNEEICQVFSGRDVEPAEALKNIVSLTSERNLAGESDVQIDKETYVKAFAPKDNLGLIIYRHKKSV